MATVRALLATLLAALPLACAAAPYGVRIGAERIVLDAPPGFADTTELASPRLQDLAATLTSASNRVLLFALSDADVRRFMTGEQLEARRYMIAVTPKGSEHAQVGTAQFAALVAESMRDLGSPAKPADVVKFLEQQPVGRANLLAELKKDPTVASVLQATRLPPLPGATRWDEKRPQYLFSTTTLLLLRGKALRLAVYSLYDGPADADWLLATTERWIDELRRLNSR